MLFESYAINLVRMLCLRFIMIQKVEALMIALYPPYLGIRMFVNSRAVKAKVVLLHCLQPTNIIMSMRNDVHIQNSILL